MDGEFQFAKSSDSQSTEDIQTFLEESVKDGCEGLMVKMLDGDPSFYEPSRRSVNWLKVTRCFVFWHDANILAAEEGLPRGFGRFA